MIMFVSIVMPLLFLCQSRTDYFTIKCPCLGCITQFRIKNDNSGKSPGLYLEYVGVKELPSSLLFQSYYQTFTCKQWISSDRQLQDKFTESSEFIGGITFNSRVHLSWKELLKITQTVIVKHLP